ncbi:MAG: hypothetical protein DMH00_07990 [Acidobacteria bacterium]|nr:MAG: hypothetical protein DMH00_07990 [Acidobacteriota bacterium]
MPERKKSVAAGIPLLLISLVGCRHANDDHHSSGPRTDIDLTVSNFSVSPGIADPEDPLTLAGTIQNIGNETANPLPGDSFLVRFNLSQDGTFELREHGFLEKQITDPIPPGSSYPFSFTAPYGGGDTQSRFGNFCTGMPCAPPETGVIGVMVDAADVIKEVDEGNNFQFVTYQVVGTRVAVTFGGCDFGTTEPGGPGCNLTVTDGLYTVTLHRPCSNCPPATEVVFPNELHRGINAVLLLKGCDRSQVPNGTCGGSWTITGETQKPGLPPDDEVFPLPCQVFFPATEHSCPASVYIRNENY